MTVPAPVLLLDADDVASLLDLDACIAAVEQAFAAHHAGTAFQPALSHVDADGGEFHVKSGGLRDVEGRAWFAAKVNGSFFGNRARNGLPNIVGLIVLSDGASGAPLAVMESGTVTRVRTGAATAVAARHLARPESDTVTVCGSGLQGAIQLRALARVLPLKRAWFWSRDRSRAERAAAAASRELGIDAAATDELSAATLRSDVIVTCTPARAWFLGRGHVRGGTFVAAVGADSPGKQELEPELVATSSVVCDLVEQCVQVGELQHAVRLGLLRADQVRGSLGAVVSDPGLRRSRDDQVILFDSTGTALQDTAAAVLVYRGAVERGLGTHFAFWR
jgi:alanine dehydrogenase